MILKKHIKLFRKFLGSIVRPRYGLKNNLAKVAKIIYLFFGWGLEMVGDAIFFWKKRRPNIAGLRKILIVKPDQLGDVLFSTFLIPLIKKKYPDAEIDYLVNPKAYDVLRKNPHIGNIYFWEDLFLGFLPGRNAAKKRGMHARNLETMRSLRDRRYDVVINARGFPPSSNLQWRKLGDTLITFDISEQSFLADYWANYSFEEEEWKNYLNLLQPLGIADFDFKEEFFNYDGEIKVSNKPYVVISPVTFDRDRRWDDGYWGELIRFFSSKGLAVALTGTRSQRNYLECISSLADDITVFTDLSLAEFGSLMRRAEFFIGIDSFPAHLALASEKKSLIFVNTDIYYLKGYSQKRFINDARCILPLLKTCAFLNVKTASVSDAEKSLIGLGLISG